MANKRDVQGILLLNKPVGMSSNQALGRVRYHFQAQKAGHTGTLDPFATGMLPICFGRTTRLAAQLLSSSKAYRATLQLGAATDTGDLTGEVVAQSSLGDISQAQVADVIQAQVGMQSQVPPMYSALKQNGVPLYRLAREGKTVARAPRTVQIHDAKLITYVDDQIVFEVTVSKGTYIRTLAEKIAQELGTVGHLIALDRLSVDPFSGMSCHDLDTVLAGSNPDQYLLSHAQILAAYPAIVLSVSDYQAFRQGQTQLSGEQCGLYRLYCEDALMGAVQFQDGKLMWRLFF